MATVIFLKDVRNRWTSNVLRKRGDEVSDLSDKQIGNLLAHSFCVIKDESNVDFTDIKSRATDEVVTFAATHNIDLTAIVGTGKGGRITLKDVKALI